MIRMECRRGKSRDGKRRQKRVEKDGDSLIVYALYAGAGLVRPSRVCRHA